METQLEETFLLVLGQGSEDLSGIQQVVLVDKLVDIERQNRQVQQKHKPVAIHQKENGQESMQAGLWNEPWIQFVAQFDWVDVVTFQIGIHDGEKHL